MCSYHYVFQLASLLIIYAFRYKNMQRITLYIIMLFGLLLSSKSEAQYAIDEVKIKAYPIPQKYQSDNPPTLPLSIENHNNRYFHDGYYYQNALPSCGQVSGIAHCLTYEFNRSRNQAFDTTRMMDPLFAFNFLNEGYGWYGVNTMETWELIKSQGTATISDFNNPSPDHSELSNYASKWMNGYENYYRAMHNRIEDYYYIDVSDGDGLKILQHYLLDHLTESETGGTAIFYSGTEFYYSEDAIAGLMEDTTYTYPFGRIGVYKYFGDIPTHSMTIVGYIPNNTIDFNEDGQITDDIDINLDGIVDFHDNEKTLWIIANSYSSYLSYFSFFKYDAISEVWDSKVFFPVPDTNYSPELTFKMKIEHPERNGLRIRAGFAENLNATKPEKYLNVPVFNYQGGAVPMDGTYDTTENNNFLEFGIDISDGLQLFKNSGKIKLFLCIDNASDKSGILKEASAIHYKENLEYEYKRSDYHTISPASYQEFSTIITLEGKAENSILDILTDEININNFANEYFEQIDVIGGNPPYTFEIINENTYTQSFDSIEFYNFAPNNWLTDSLSEYNLNFEFPIGEQSFDRIYVGGDMSIYFKEQDKPSFFRDYPYPLVSSGMYDEFQIYPMNGIPQKNPMKSQTIRTDSSFIVGVKASTIHAAAIELFPNGKVNIIYHPLINDYSINAGINTSNSCYYSKLPRVERTIRKYNKVSFIPKARSTAYTISQDGYLNILPTQNISDTVLYLKVTDANEAETFKEININYNNYDNPKLAIYPNPVNNTTQLVFKSADTKKMQLQIISANGSIISSQSINANKGYNYHNINVNTIGLNQGIYLVRLISDSTKISSKMQVL
jgi:hypothetical protein